MSRLLASVARYRSGDGDRGRRAEGEEQVDRVEFVLARIHRASVSRGSGRFRGGAPWWLVQGRRRWRGLDSGTVRVTWRPTRASPVVPYHRAHGRHGAVSTPRRPEAHLCIDDTVASLAVALFETAVCDLIIASRTVGRSSPGLDRHQGSLDQFGPARIGIDRDLVRAPPHLPDDDHQDDMAGFHRPHQATPTPALQRSFDASRADAVAVLRACLARRGQKLYSDIVIARYPHTIRCTNPFHVVASAPKAPRCRAARTWNDARRSHAPRPNGAAGTDEDAPPRPGYRAGPQDSRAPAMRCWQDPSDLTDATAPSWPGYAQTDPRLHCAVCSKRAAPCVRGSRAGRRTALDSSISLGTPLPHPGASSPAASSDAARPSTPPWTLRTMAQGLMEDPPTPSSDCWTRVGSDSVPRSPHRPGRVRPRRGRPALPGRTEDPLDRRRWPAVRMPKPIADVIG